MARITGLGGIFHKVADPAASARWYAEVLGISGEYGILLPWSLDETGEAFSLVSHFTADSGYFSPSAAPFMINLRVDDIDGFVAGLEAKGIAILGRQDEDYGRFAWIIDCDGIKIELYEQIGASPA